MGAVDVRLGQIELAAIAKILGQAAQDALERLVFDPRLKSPMAGLIRRVPTRQVSPRSTGAKHPKHAIDDRPRFFPRPAAPLGGALQFLGGKAALDRVPLLIGEVHLQP